MEYANFAHPFLDRNILGVLADYVTMDQGTGVVHTAPAHGADDFNTGQKYKLDPTCNVDAGGRLRNGLPEYDGLQVFKANEPMVELLRSRGVLMHTEKLQHSYPHCWRCHNPIIFRATEQWFISMETPMDGGTLRSRTLDEIKRVKWDPGVGRRAHLEHDRHAAGLVHFAAAHLGCSHRGVSLRRLRQAPARSRTQSQSRRTLRQVGRGRLVHAGSRCSTPVGNEVPGLRGIKLHQRN
jgi:hypothetical protein